MRDEIEDGMGCAGLVPTKAEESAEDAFRREREANERNERDYNAEINTLCEERSRLLNDKAVMSAAMRCAYQNLEQSANNPIPSLLAVRAALQALRPYV